MMSASIALLLFAAAETSPVSGPALDHVIQCEVEGNSTNGDGVTELGTMTWTLEFSSSVFSVQDSEDISALLTVSNHPNFEDARTGLSVSRRRTHYREGALAEGTFAFSSTSDRAAADRVLVSYLVDDGFSLTAFGSDFANCPHGPGPNSPANACQDTFRSYTGTCELITEELQ